MKQNKKPFDIPNILTSLKTQYKNGLLTLEEVAEKLYKYNWTFYIDLDRAKKIVTDKTEKQEQGK